MYLDEEGKWPMIIPFGLEKEEEDLLVAELKRVASISCWDSFDPP